jgi:hypothetical protein
MRKAEPLAALGGLALLASLWLEWYAFNATGWVDYRPDGTVQLLYVRGSSLTAWSVFTVTPYVLALLALLAIAVPVTSLATRGPAWSIGTAVLASAFGWIAVVLIAFRVLLPPDDLVEPTTGIYLSLASAIVAWVGSWLSMRDESAPRTAAPDVPRLAAP